MQSVVNFFRSYVRVEITCPFPERFLNICSQNGIAFWDLERVSEVCLRTNMFLDGFRALRPFASQMSCRVRILRKTGARFFLWRFRKRQALVAGLLVCVALVGALSQFVWDIDIAGNSLVPDAAILRALKDAGFGVGSYTGSLNHDALQNDLLIKLPELSWIAVNISGSRANVEVRERIKKPEIIPKNVPCNIVAKKTGIILSMEVLSGQEQVKAGQTVQEGDLLVSGIVDSQVLGARFVHSMARIEARTWFSKEAVLPLEVSLKEYTGREREKTALLIAGWRINLYFKAGNPYVSCDKIVKKTRLALPGGLALPFSVIKETFREYEPLRRAVTEASAREVLKSVLLARLSETGGALVSDDYSFEVSGALAHMKLTAECRERIEQSVAIPMEAARNVADDR